jgi:uncharacterized sulfatase
MTGKYPARLHLTDYIAGNDPRDRKLVTPRWRKYLPLEETTLAEALSERGYVTGHFGKWHLNKDKDYRPGRPGDPGSQGFDEVLTTLKPESDADPLKDAHNVHKITDRSIQFISDHREGPFFCYVTHNSIHRPQMEDPDLVAQYKSRPDADGEKNKPVAAAMMQVLDRSVGRILETLVELSLVDNTIVIFYSDNGALGNPEVLKPLRGSKANLYEGGIRVPLIVRWPGKVQPGSLSSTLCTDIDLFPTLIEATGTTPVSEKLDGLSLLPILTGSGSIQREALYWHYPHYHHRGINPAGAIRMGDFKLIEWFEKSIDGADTEGALELYNLKDDPSEQNNLVGEMPDLARKLYQQLQAWRTSVDAQMMTVNSAATRDGSPTEAQP